MTNGTHGGIQIRGSIPAIVTPMHEDGSLDLPAFRKLIDWHVEEGSNGLVVVGTSGESATLSVDEHILMVKTAVDSRACLIIFLSLIGTPAARMRPLSCDSSLCFKTGKACRA